MTTQASEALYNFKTNMQLVYQLNSNPCLGFWLSGNQYSHLSMETSIQQHMGLVDPDTLSNVSVRSAGGMAPDPSLTIGDPLAFPPDASGSGNGGGDGSGERRVMHDRDPTLPAAAGRMERNRSEVEARERRRCFGQGRRKRRSCAAACRQGSRQVRWTGWQLVGSRQCATRATAVSCGWAGRVVKEVWSLDGYARRALEGMGLAGVGKVTPAHATRAIVVSYRRVGEGSEGGPGLSG